MVNISCIYNLITEKGGGLLLIVDNVKKKFGGLTAVNDVSFEVNKGEIFGLIGPNGSGKTTIFNLITGFLKLTNGVIKFNDEVITNKKPNKIVEKGISRTFQITSILPDHSVKENIKAGLFSKTNTNLFDELTANSAFRREETRSEEKVKDILSLIELEEKKNNDGKHITPAEQRKLMIGIALARNPDLIMLDEPAAGTSSVEQQDLIHLIKKINKNGTTVLIIEHHMDIMMDICDRIVALNFGHKIAEGSPEDIQSNQDVITAYLGSDENDT